jgi:hypothetical protein
MAATPHRECYGRLFPGIIHLPEDRAASGKVFSVLLQRVGGMYRSARSVAADLDQWDECEQCPEFEGCYRFSMAKLALEAAVQNR